MRHSSSAALVVLVVTGVAVAMLGWCKLSVSAGPRHPSSQNIRPSRGATPEIKAFRPECAAVGTTSVELDISGENLQNFFFRPGNTISPEFGVMCSGTEMKFDNFKLLSPSHATMRVLIPPNFPAAGCTVRGARAASGEQLSFTLTPAVTGGSLKGDFLGEGHLSYSDLLDRTIKMQGEARDKIMAAINAHKTPPPPEEKGVLSVGANTVKYTHAGQTLFDRPMSELMAVENPVGYGEDSAYLRIVFRDGKSYNFAIDDTRQGCTGGKTSQLYGYKILKILLGK